MLPRCANTVLPRNKRRGQEHVGPEALDPVEPQRPPLRRNGQRRDRLRPAEQHRRHQPIEPVDQVAFDEPRAEYRAAFAQNARDSARTQRLEGELKIELERLWGTDVQHVGNVFECGERLARAGRREHDRRSVAGFGLKDRVLR
jgi:hypothetical protein